MNRILLLPVLLGTLASASTPSHPVLTFHADWSISTSAPLVAGQPAILRYELDRLPACRGLNWGVSSHFITENTHRHDLWYWGDSSGATQFERPFIVPFGPDIEFWFQGSDSNGCSQWDSNWGLNHHVTPRNPSPVIHFRRDWSVVVEGALKAGGPVTIDFDMWRIPFCNAITSYDTYTGDATLYYRFDGGPTQQVSMLGTPEGFPTSIDGQAGRYQLPPTLQTPVGATRLEVWFLGSKPATATESGCTDWDSNYGNNYTFTLSP